MKAHQQRMVFRPGCNDDGLVARCYEQEIKGLCVTIRKTDPRHVSLIKDRTNTSTKATLSAPREYQARVTYLLFAYCYKHKIQIGVAKRELDQAKKERIVGQKTALGVICVTVALYLLKLMSSILSSPSSSVSSTTPPTSAQ